MNITRNLTTLITVYLLLPACHQPKNSNSIKGLIIDPGIKQEAEKHIENLKEFDSVDNRMAIYKNAIFLDAFENDSLIFSSIDTPKKVLFKSFYLWRKDTLMIDGGIGLFGTVGFGINISKDSVTLYHMLSSDEIPGYAYREKDSLEFRLQVPCTDTKIILSEIPDSTKSQIIYGYVEFKSTNYFESDGQQDGQEQLPRKKMRSNMKIYFKSSRLSLQP